jgi:iron complex outermembrane recepter protein
LLTPERSISRTAGFVYNPGWAPGFDFSADYWKIELLNAVSTIGPQTILNGCFLGGDASYCDLITRGTGPRGNSSSGSSITDILNVNVNIGGIKTEGVDLSTHYKFPSSSVGDFKLGLDWTFTKQFVMTVPYGAGQLSSQDLAGTTSFPGSIGAVTQVGGTPKQRANVNLTWSAGDWSATWSAEYIAAMTEDCDGTYAFFGATQATANQVPIAEKEVQTRCTNQHGSFPFDSNAVVPTNHLGATFYHDVAGTYHADSLNTDFTFGIRNLFDKEPPIAMSAFANSFLPAFYRAPGRFFYGRIGVKF